MTNVEARVTRLLDELEKPETTEKEAVEIRSKIEFLQGLEQS